MKALIQRVARAKVDIEGRTVSAVGRGQLILLGVEKGDTVEEAAYLAKKAANLRIFEDEAGKMNLDAKAIGGEFLVVSQFTLAGDTRRGNRPGFETAAAPETARQLYEYFIDCLKQNGHPVASGIFQTDMQVELVNDGPVTFMLEKHPPREDCNGK